jgi:hypothetical protein
MRIDKQTATRTALWLWSRRKEIRIDSHPPSDASYLIFDCPEKLADAIVQMEDSYALAAVAYKAYQVHLADPCPSFWDLPAYLHDGWKAVADAVLKAKGVSDD